MLMHFLAVAVKDAIIIGIRCDNAQLGVLILCSEREPEDKNW
jgi:hypothetical protein